MILKNNLFIKNIQRGTLAFCAVAVPFFAIADQAIRSVTGSVQGGAEVLRVELTASNMISNELPCNSALYDVGCLRFRTIRDRPPASTTFADLRLP